MKKIIIMFMLVMAPAVGVNTVTYAQVADVEIVINIPGNNVERVKNGFMEVRPIPDTNYDGVPDYNAKAWLKKCIRDFVKGTVLEGESRLRHRVANSNVNNDDVTE